MIYFAYGSNMDPVQMEQRCPGARALGAASLRDHRLIFTYDSARWRGGVGSVVPAPGEDVWGVLWDLDEEHVRVLDRYEMVHRDVYRKEFTDVEHEGARANALIYIANDTKPKKPSRKYIDALVRGARAHALPEDYIARLDVV